MSLFDAKPTDRRQWLRVGDAYEITKKPRGLDTSSWATIPFAPMASIPQGGAYAPDFTLKALTEIKSGTYFERGDILIAKITPSFENGKQALVTGLPTPFGFATTEVIPLRPRNDKHDQRLLFFYLLHPDVRHHIAERMEGTTGRQRVPKEVLLDLPFPKFGPEEQTSISDSLEMIQRLTLIEIKLEQIATVLKNATMQTLFTCGLRGETQKETEIGPIPESWKVSTLGAEIELAYGKSLPAHAREPGPFNVFGSNGVVGRHSTALVSCPGIIIGRKGSVGEVTYSDTDYWPIDTTYYVKNKNNHDWRFLFYLLSSLKLTELNSHSAIPGLNRENVYSIAAQWPDSPEQCEIVAILDTIDRKIDLHRRKRAVLDDLFKALLHKLMTGEIRVGDLDLSTLGQSAISKFLPQEDRSTLEEEQP